MKWSDLCLKKVTGYCVDSRSWMGGRARAEAGGHLGTQCRDQGEKTVSEISCSGDIES